MHFFQGVIMVRLNKIAAACAIALAAGSASASSLSDFPFV